jgi:alginate O-acetyltransferase complex protein AlgI
MHAKTEMLPPLRHVRTPMTGKVRAGLGWGAGIAAAGGAAWLTRNHPPWAMMWAIAGTEFLALKLATLHGTATKDAPGRTLAYVCGWPGMNARAFLRETKTAIAPTPTWGEFSFASAKLALGLGLATWTTLYVGEIPEAAAGWAGMLGIIFSLHFGLLHLVSWGWRRAGVDAPPIMRAPIAATSLAEFWGERWNIAFADGARRFIMRPLARRWGAGRAGLAVFLISGLLHETVVSLPARGGWGGPTLYFLLHAAGLAFEKSALGIRLGLGRGVRGWLWTLLVALAPLPLLFHAPFVHHVIVPLYRSLAALLP